METTEHLEIPELPESTILLVEVGSTAHGTGIDGGEDHDELGIVVEPATTILGLSEKGFKTVMQRTQPEGVKSGPGDIDRTLYSLRRFLRLAAGGNPSVMMALWAPVEHITAEGRELRLLGDAFVGRHVIPRYRGYMRAQANKVLNAPDPATEYEVRTKSSMHAARLGMQCRELLATGKLSLPIEGEERAWLRAVRYGHVPFAEWASQVASLDAELERLLADGELPAGPDRARIATWSVATHQAVWR